MVMWRFGWFWRRLYFSLYLNCTKAELISREYGEEILNTKTIKSWTIETRKLKKKTQVQSRWESLIPLSGALTILSCPFVCSVIQLLWSYKIALNLDFWLGIVSSWRGCIGTVTGRGRGYRLLFKLHWNVSYGSSGRGGSRTALERSCPVCRWCGPRCLCRSAHRTWNCSGNSSASPGKTKQTIEQRWSRGYVNEAVGYSTYFSAVVARYLAERLVAVDDGIVDDLSIGQYEAAVGCSRMQITFKLCRSVASINVIFVGGAQRVNTSQRLQSTLFKRVLFSCRRHCPA